MKVFPESSGDCARLFQRTSWLKEERLMYKECRQLLKNLNGEKAVRHLKIVGFCVIRHLRKYAGNPCFCCQPNECLRGFDCDNRKCEESVTFELVVLVLVTKLDIIAFTYTSLTPLILDDELTVQDIRYCMLIERNTESVRCIILLQSHSRTCHTG